MTTQLTLPRLEMSMTEGTLAEWLVADGADVKEGDALYSLETAKSVVEITAPVSGKLVQRGTPGTTYDVGADIGEIV